MAIGYGRSVFIKRSAGGSVLLAAAYIGRSKARLGKTFVDYSGKRDLLLPMRTVLPAGAPQRLGEPMVLWREMEAAAGRKDAVLGQHLILALPDAREFGKALAVALVEDFIGEMIMPHQLAASFAIHEPHLGEPETGSAFLDRLEGAHGPDVEGRLARRNIHCHILVSPRQVSALGLDGYRYTGLEPRHGTRRKAEAPGSGKEVLYEEVYDGIDWGKRWSEFQNAFFARNGSALRVRPQVPFGTRHLGAARVAARRKDIGAGAIAAPFGPTIDAVVERANRAIAADPRRLLGLVGRAPFRRADISSLVDRFLVSHRQPKAILREALARPEVFELGDRATANAMGWYATAELAGNEQRVLVLAAALGERGAEAPAGHAAPGPGDAAGIAHDAVVNGGIAVIDCPDDAAPALRGALAAAALETGLGSIAVGHGFGQQTEFPASFRITGLLRHEPKGNVLILDCADGCPPARLVPVLEAALRKPEGRVILIRRPNRSSCPRTSLLDLVARLARRRTIAEEPAPSGPRELLRARQWQAAVSLLAAQGAIRFVPRAELVEATAGIATKLQAIGWRIETADAELLAFLRLKRLGSSRLAPGPGGRTVLVHSETGPQLPSVLARLLKIDDPLLLVDSAVAPGLEVLAAQVELACGPRSAITFPLAATTPLASPSALRPLADGPRLEWAIDAAGKAVTGAEAILNVLEAELGAPPRSTWKTPWTPPAAPGLRSNLEPLLAATAAGNATDHADDTEFGIADDVRPGDFEALPDDVEDDPDHGAAAEAVFDSDLDLVPETDDEPDPEPRN